MSESWEERQKAREKPTWARFSWQSGQISFYPQCTDSKECFLYFLLFLCVCVFVFRHVDVVRRRVQPTVTRASVPRGSAATVGSCAS